MKRMAVLLILVATGSVLAGGPADRLWWGGGIGLAFGDVDYVAAEPVVGFRVTDDVSVGLGLIYRYRDDDRFTPSLSTEDYGANLFARYRVAPQMFLQAEYEYLDYEFQFFDGSTARDSYSSLLGGVGYSQPLSGRASFFTTVLYNFSYDEDELSPYDEPWVFRAGISVGF